MMYFSSASGMKSPPPKEKRVVFLLLNRFNLMSFSTAIEAFRVANKLNKDIYFQCITIKETGDAALSSAGIQIPIKSGLIELNAQDILIICGGEDPQSAPSKNLVLWLNRQYRAQVPILGLGSAIVIMAKSGILQERQATLHWSQRDSFYEDFHDIDLSSQIFCQDANLWSSAGGGATSDMILKLMALNFGPNLAAQVAEYMICAPVRDETHIQRSPCPGNLRRSQPKFSRALELMEANIETPISPAHIATEIGLSTRQLERLFRTQLNTSPKKHYMQLRLSKARNLLTQTEMSVLNIAIACGFSSTTHFSKCYREQYNVTPYQEESSLYTIDALSGLQGA